MYLSFQQNILQIESAYDKTNKMVCAPNEDSVWSESSMSVWRKLDSLATTSAQWWLWSDWADAQADLSLRWAHMPFCWFCHALADFFFSYFPMKNTLYMCLLEAPRKCRMFSWRYKKRKYNLDIPLAGAMKTRFFYLFYGCFYHIIQGK